MRLHKCRRVEQYLTDHGLVDARQIWCYAQAKICGEAGNFLECGLVLGCVKGETLFLYETYYNTTELKLIYTCDIQEMCDKQVKSGLFTTRFTFICGGKVFRLDMDDWKRFAGVLCG